MANAVRNALDTARRAATDPATPARLKSGVKDGVGRVLATAKDPAKVRTSLKDGAAWTVNRLHPAVIRVSGGRVGTSIGKAPILLLTTTGARSGKARTVPLLYLTDGDRLAVIASYGGDDRAPAWFHNLLADPACSVEVDGTTRAMTAAVADPATKARLWAEAVAIYKGYDSYQRRTDRDIPIVVLTPAP